MGSLVILLLKKICDLFPLKNYKQICKKSVIKNSQSSPFKDKIVQKNELFLKMPKYRDVSRKKKFDDVITSVYKYGKICKFGLKWTLLNPI
jgi:hypothetical protein